MADELWLAVTMDPKPGDTLVNGDETVTVASVERHLVRAVDVDGHGMLFTRDSWSEICRLAESIRRGEQSWERTR